MSFISEIYEATTLNEYKFDKDENDLVKINRHNVILAEAIYQKMYKNYLEDISEKDLNFLLKEEPKKWTAKKCFMVMKEIGDDEYKFEELIKQACLAVNSENSTHLWASDREKIIDFIMSEYGNKRGFEQALKDKKSYPIVEKIRELNTIRKNYSFATKLCHYAAFYLFDKEDDRDMYSIYDSVLVKALKARGQEVKYNEEYSKYQDIIEMMIEESEEKISRNGFDHLMWIYYK